MFMSSKALRSWIASLIFLLLIVGIIFFLTMVPIPSESRDLISSIVGMIVGSMSMAISIFVGRDPNDVAEFKQQIQELNDDRNSLIERLRDSFLAQERLQTSHRELQDAVIDKLSVFVGEGRLKELGAGGSLSEDVAESRSRSQ